MVAHSWVPEKRNRCLHVGIPSFCCRSYFAEGALVACTSPSQAFQSAARRNRTTSWGGTRRDTCPVASPSAAPVHTLVT
eukprot:CAMPEP_0206286042 /NCGR_PEP_ID=MMETSP0106_2-20121207/401_1 /ASSEMBLY_ACC=CAM_ASM_000206 /TAXON_ID=81532 /ORGANISM="Acanthoeca-like sp., Strain 10tr" /LENGTH=78 /DNA_ID=CAMNT_0053716561 /DNA_START=234 /DNA_END=470 /DNA_ORIENTATION=+